MTLKSFKTGYAFDAHSYFGAHFEEGGVVFRVYAPKAARVTLYGDFNGWREADASYQAHGIWVFRDPYARAGQNYKYVVYSKRGKRQEHADPYGYGMGGLGCSVIRDLTQYRFNDDKWMQSRTLNLDKPMSIYELHLVSWRRSGSRYPTYDGIADDLIRYLKENHYTHVEFLPLNEHPLDGSWGYQATGFFSPTARFGEATQLMALINRLHGAGIGAILDFVCVHFAVDRYGLKTFDGGALYESSKTLNRRSDWGSYFFDHSKGEVRSFLQSAANYWLSVYHFDGLRFDAVSRLIYGHGEPQYGENPGGLDFMRRMNDGLARLHPTAMLIAEDSTSYPNVTKPTFEGGLGFTYKWAMGWTYDALGFFMMPPQQRPGQSWRLGNALGYFGSERFLLPLSHDEAGRGAITARMPGTAREKLKNAKLLYLYMTVHPGKMLNFMGAELGTTSTWNTRSAQDWTLLGVPANLGFQFFCADLNRLYAENAALFEADYKDWGARWLSCDDNGNGVYVLIRHSVGRHVLLIMNTSDGDRQHGFSLPHATGASLLLHSQWAQYGGHVARKEECFRLENDWFSFWLPKLSGMLVEVWFK